MKRPVMPERIYEPFAPYWLSDNREQCRQKIIIPSEDGDDEPEEGLPTFPLKMQMFKDFGAANGIDPDKVCVDVRFGAHELELYFEGFRARSKEDLKKAKDEHAKNLAAYQTKLRQYEKDKAQYDIDIRQYSVWELEQKLAAAKKAAGK